MDEAQNELNAFFKTAFEELFKYADLDKRIDFLITNLKPANDEPIRVKKY